jgi:5-formyltetrahydrofolate cyclo-ligase
MKEVRKSLGETEVQALSRRIQTRLLNLDVVRQAVTVLVYVSIGKEVQTGELLHQFWQQGKRVAVPQVLDDQVQAFEVPADCGWEKGPFGLPVPRVSSPLSAPIDVCIVPGLAFSLRCDRLGFGYGHWDRFFGRVSVKTVIGICYDRQIVPAIPVESTDRPADMVMTEHRILFRGPSS